MPDAQLPLQPVEEPIICSPYVEPDEHWLYDTRTGVPAKEPDGVTRGTGSRPSAPAVFNGRC